MTEPMINFRTIRPHHGSQHGGFEELVCQLAILDTPAGVPFVRKGMGADGGVECYRVESNESETGWQAKFFFEFGSGEAGQLKESFDNAVDKHPKLAKYIVCLPFDLSDGRVGKKKSERDRWIDWVASRRRDIAPRNVEILLWGAFELTERLSRNDPLYVGRRTYWFDLPHFGTKWLRDRFEISRRALGRRYTPELNVELPIRQALAAFARDPKYVLRIAAWADEIDEARARCLHYIYDALKESPSNEVETLERQCVAASAAIRSAKLGPTDSVPFEHWRNLLLAATQTLDRSRSVLWGIPNKERGSGEETKNAIYFAEKLREELGRIIDWLDAPENKFANANRLMLVGDAGIGKSHLLADVADHHIESGYPALLLLGGAFTDADPWRQIVDQLGLTTTPPDAILGALDAAAEAAGTRALVIVDAINERNGVAIWSTRLAPFLATADRFHHISVLVSCRTTYLPYIVRDLDERVLPQVHHPGFAGRAADAARRYLDQRGIVRMAAPNFSPEFENPLFLRTCCDMLERRGLRELPRGLSGVSSVFNFYFDAVVETLNQRMGLVSRLKRVEEGLEAITKAMVDAGSGYLPIRTVDALLEAVVPSAGRSDQSLFFQLENEGVLSVEPVRNVEAVEEMVRFTFERMSDHRIAQRLLDSHVGSGDPAPAFSDGGRLAHYVTGREARRFAGIAEALSVQLPERYGVELIDLVADESAQWNLARSFYHSLLWRQQEVFTEHTLELVERWADVIGSYDPLMEVVVSIATEPKNPFNADHLDRKLKLMAMPDRDVEWSIRLAKLADDSEGPIHTLIGWVLSNGLEKMDPPRARLAAITLAWLTTLSHRWVRDMATKALAVLLVERRDLAESLIWQFSDVDDAYVLDRLLAAVYGAAMRRWGNEGLADIARAAYSTVFERMPMADHALIRDHARGIVELAESRGVLPSDITLKRVRPPYPTGTPLERIPDETMDTYMQDYGSGRFRDRICSSAVEDGDFARYEIDPLAGSFTKLPKEENGRSLSQIYEAWRADVIDPHPPRVVALEQVIEMSLRAHTVQSRLGAFSRGGDLAKDIELRRLADAKRDAAIGDLEGLLDQNEVQEFRLRAEPYLRAGMVNPRGGAWIPTYAGNMTRRWVAWRAHELGWTQERFGEFDNNVRSHDRMDHRVERIGKKYQWIAYHELAGRLSDIALLVDQYGDGPELYQGPWQTRGREMDPTILVTHTKQRELDRHGATWWSPHMSRWREDSPAARIAWMKDRRHDIPVPSEQIDVADRDGRRWLVLNIKVARNHLVMVNGERLIHRMTWHKVESLLVKRGEADLLQEHLIRNPRDRDRLSELEMPFWTYLGEYPWHPAFSGIDGRWNIGSRFEVQSTVADWYFERSGHNYSIEDSFNLTVPAPALARGLQLRLAEGRSLAYAAADGRILFKDPSADEPGFSAAVVDREALRSFLASEGLEIIWVFAGEKSVHGGKPHGSAWGGRLGYSGIYRLGSNHLEGDLIFEYQSPHKDQLQELMAYP